MIQLLLREYLMYQSNVYRFQSVKSMLQSGLDRQPLPELLLMPSPVTHENLRGPGYYAAQQTRREVGQC